MLPLPRAANGTDADVARSRVAMWTRQRWQSNLVRRSWEAAEARTTGPFLSLSRKKVSLGWLKAPMERPNPRAT